MEKTLFFLFILPLFNTQNLIVNGDFSWPVLSNNSASFQGASFWNGSNFDLDNRKKMPDVQGQYCDLQSNNNATGIISQNVIIKDTLMLELSFLALTNDQFPTHYLEVYWNNQLIKKIRPNTSNCQYYVYQITSIIGVNILSFREVGNQREDGYYLDDISLIPQYNFTLNPFINQSSSSSSASLDIQSDSDKTDPQTEQLTHGQNKTLNDLSQFSEGVMAKTLDIYTIIRTSFVSFFLLGTVNFWNLSLMYNMLPIKSVPQFTRTFLQKLTLLFYKPNSGTNMIATNFPQYKHIFSPQADKVQKMNKTEDEIVWFGTYNISSLFFRNNIQNLLLLLALFFKIGLPFVISQLQAIPVCIRSKVPNKLTLLSFLLQQLIGLQVFMLISAGQNLFNFGSADTSEKWNSILHLMTVCGSFLVFPLNLMVAIKVDQNQHLKKTCQKVSQSTPTTNRSKKSKRVRFSQQPSTALQIRIRNRNKKIHITQLYNMTEYLLMPIIPLLVHLKNSFAFLTTTSIIIIFRMYWYCQYVSKQLLLTKNEKIFTFINILFWAFLQIIYFTFLFIQITAAVQIGQFAKIFGFMSVFVICVGGVFEVIRNLVKNVMFVVLKIMQVVGKITRWKQKGNQNRIMDTQTVKKQTLRKQTSLKVQKISQQCWHGCQQQLQQSNNCESIIQKVGYQQKSKKIIHIRNNSESGLLETEDRKNMKSKKRYKRDKQKIMQDLRKTQQNFSIFNQ